MKRYSLRQPLKISKSTEALINKASERLQDSNLPIGLFFDFYEGEFNNSLSDFCLALLLAMQDSHESGAITCKRELISTWYSEDIQDELLSEIVRESLFPIEFADNAMLEAQLRRALIIVDDNGLSFTRFAHAKSQLQEELARILKSRSINFSLNFNVIENGLNEQQRQAIEYCSNGPLSVVSGGPGTGKTRVIANMAAAYMAGGGNPEQLKLMAPTGKAAFRLGESINELVKSSSFDDSIISQLLDLQASTIHRAIGLNDRAPAYHRLRPMQVNMVIVDESSMIDLELFLSLCRALPHDCKIVLVGDSNQLPPVEAGAVFTGVLNSLVQLPGVSATILEKNYRSNTQLQELANQINQGAKSSIKTATVDEIHKQTGAIILSKAETYEEHLRNWCHEAFLKGGQSFVSDCIKLNQYELPEESQLKNLFSRLKQFQILCMSKQGQGGVHSINELFKGILSQKVPYKMRRGGLFPGAVIALNTNNYELNIFNGDSGFVFQNKNGDYYLVLEGNRNSTTVGSYSLVNTQQLARYEFAYAMTVHKSQGSEFNNVLLSCPQKLNTNLANRQLLYTAVTRAKNSICILSSQEIIDACIDNRRNDSMQLQLS